ncbi:MAG TPA: NAD-dependent epimerase/dehydratase family protein [Clostridiales bacterium]|jgi:nucleoside-diphosphate-sugar epimerase|nr:NAD-dependent epimerase/dehydratase family protein [Clostridiales bacterium]HQP69895.1 NAD-dependent epimerase/dehydratase family protein [Clostridiales bacterium]
MGKVLITGASGFIGSHIVELFADKHIPAVCLVRNSSDTAFLKNLGLEPVYGDIKDTESLRSALKDIDFVIHTAGKSSDWGGYQDFYDNNVSGTINILEASISAGIKDVIITGSVSSYGEEDCSSVKNEDSPYNSHYRYFCGRIFPSAMNHYRDTKALLTQKSIEFAEKNKINLTIIEPVWVYGEREFSSGFYEYLKTVHSGIRFMPGSPSNKFHVIYAGDLAQAYLAAYLKKQKGVSRIIIGDPKAQNMNYIHSLFCSNADLKPPALLPKFLTYPVGICLELAASLFRSEKPPLLSRARVNMMYDSIEYSTARSEKLLGFKAVTPLEEGIKRTVDWYKSNGFLED